MKRSLAFILAVLFVLSLLPATAHAAPEKAGTLSVTQQPTTRIYQTPYKFVKADLAGLQFEYTPTGSASAIPETDPLNDDKFSIVSPKINEEYTKPSTVTIKFRYTYETDKYVEGEVSFTIKHELLDDLVISQAPSKTTYYAGEQLNIGDMVVKAEYTKDGLKTIDHDDLTFSPSRTDALTAGDSGDGYKKPMTVTYTEDGIKKTATQTIVVKPAVMSVSVTAAKTKLYTQPTPETTTVTPGSSAADTNACVWVSSDTGVVKIASVSAANVATVEAVAPGTATVTLRAIGSNVTDSVEITVEQYKKIYPLDFQLTATVPAALPIGSPLLATVSNFYPYDTTEKDITWSSSDESVATVSSDGQVMPVSVGTATITATAQASAVAIADTGHPGNKTTTPVTKTFVVNVVHVPVSSFTLSASAITLYADDSVSKGSSQQITATVGPVNATDKSVAWSSADPTIATVSATGLISAKKTGTVVITATADGALTRTVTVTVKAAKMVNEFSIDPTVATLNVGDSITPVQKILPTDATSKTIRWEVVGGGDTIVTVNANGKITAVGPGTATVRGTTTDGSEKTVTCQVTVSTVSVISVLMADKTAYVDETQTVQLGASIFPASATNRSVVWKSLNEAVATVNGSGLVTGVSGGYAVIRATAADGSGAYGDCVVTVGGRTKVTSLTLNYSNFTLMLNDSTYIRATILPSTATINKATWESGNSAIVTIDANGLAKGVGVGKAVITATADGISRSITVTVAKERSDYGVVVNCTRRVNVRASASGSSTHVGYAYLSQSFQILGQKGDWYLIQFTPDKTAYIWKSYLSTDNTMSYVSATEGAVDTTQPDTTTSTPPDTATGSTVTITNCRRRVNVRSEASPSSAHMGYAYLNGVYTYLGTSGDWYKVSFEGVTAYIHKAYCSLST